MRGLRKLLTVGAWVLVFAAAGCAIAAININRILQSPVNVPEGGLAFEIEPGSSVHRVSNDLAAAGAIGHPRIFRGVARWKGLAGAFQAGDYLIAADSTPLDLLDQFTRGDVRLYSFTLIEGWNRWELLAALHAHAAVEAAMSDEDWPALLEELGASTQHPEGLFLPETYYFARGTSDRAVLAQAYAHMQDVLDEEWAQRADGLPLQSAYEALTLASIVEKETARTDERARIAGVFVRRLQKRMRLQTDPTVIYGIGEQFDGNLTRRDLKTDTPYNTYTRGGLPPTPIAMPGRAAIRAALHPAAGDELFFVATGLGDGSHKFSATKAEHDSAVAEYLRQLRRNRQ
jgi:UPF0755 protein